MSNFFKAILFGIIEGITEWLPISSTGHMILLKQWMPLHVTPEFWEVFLVVIQLGAVFAVVIVYHKDFTPKRILQNISLWLKTLIAILPAIIIALPLDDYIESKFYNPLTVAITLIFYGIMFILLEVKNQDAAFRITHISQITYGHALFVGCFQLLALIPGTSRSGATIIGAMLLGISREAAAQFTFYLALPVMFGASAFKISKYALSEHVLLTPNDTAILLVGMAVSCLVSIFVIHFLLNFIKKHSFIPFGIYRILLGISLLFFF